jgi:arginine/serine-rich splicing factor 7
MVDNSPLTKDRKRSLSPEEGSPMREKYSPKENAPSPRGNDDDGIDQSRSPRDDRSPRVGHSPREDRSPAEDDDQ